MSTRTNPFDQCSEQYGKFRPDYPVELIDHIESLCKTLVEPLLLDVGAGTGKASAPFAARGLSVVSVEPSLAMAAEALRSYPNLRYLCSTAEQLPLRGGSVDAIVCGQAFHWFNPKQALTEFSRVLTSEGYVFLFWNGRDRRAPQVLAFENLIQKWNPGHDAAYRDQDIAKLMRQSGSIQFVEDRQFAFAKPMNIDDWIGLSRSISYVHSMGEAKVPGFEADLREALTGFESIECPYVTQVWVGQRL